MLSEKAQQPFYSKAGFKLMSHPPLIISTFYTGTTENILTTCITVWYVNCKVSEWSRLKKLLQHQILFWWNSTKISSSLEERKTRWTLWVLLMLLPYMWSMYLLSFSLFFTHSCYFAIALNWTMVFEKFYFDVQYVIHMYRNDNKSEFTVLYT